MAAAYALIFYRNAYDKVHTESTKKRLNQLIKLRFSLFNSLNYVALNFTFLQATRCIY